MKRRRREFAIYYDLYNKYKSDYQIQNILDGTYSDEIRERASNAKFDERLTLIGLLLESVGEHIRKDVETEDYVTELHKLLKELKMVCASVPTRNRENYRYDSREIYRGPHSLLPGRKKRSSVLSAERETILRKGSF